MANKWHVWTISTNKYRKIKEYIDTILEIKDVLYPVAEKEHSTKSGIKKENVPLYANYLFIKYDHSDNETISKLKKYPWIHNYLGVCSQEEIKEIRKMDKTRYEDLVPVSKLKVGMNVKLISTPFKGMIATLVGIDGNKLSVSIKIFGAERIIKCSIDDVDTEKVNG